MTYLPFAGTVCAAMTHEQIRDEKGRVLLEEREARGRLTLASRTFDVEFERLRGMIVQFESALMSTTFNPARLETLHAAISPTALIAAKTNLDVAVVEVSSVTVKMKELGM